MPERINAEGLCPQWSMAWVHENDSAMAVVYCQLPEGHEGKHHAVVDDIPFDWTSGTSENLDQ